MYDEQHEPGNVNPQTAADIAEGETAEPSTEQTDAEEVRAALAQCQQELQEAKNANLRSHADFDNFRKRMRAERDHEYARGSDRVLTDLLPVVDDFERAMAAVNEKSTVASLQHGVELIYRQLLSLLERYHLAQMAVEGKPFDPKYHDAVARVTTTEIPEHTIVGEIQRGYTRDGDVFRPAKVAVSVTPEDQIAE